MSLLRVGICTALTFNTLEKLRAHGIKTATDFIVKNIEHLSQETQIPYKDLCSIYKVLLAENSAFPVVASSLYEKAISSLMILSSGCQSLDDLLDGGLYTGELTEIAGDTIAGKTRASAFRCLHQPFGYSATFQICTWCSAMTVLVGDHSVVYIDTSASFSAEYLLDVMKKNIFPQQDVNDEFLQLKLQRVKYVQVFDIYDLFSTLDAIITDLNKQTPTSFLNLKLLVVDSLASLIYPIMGGNIGFCQGLLCQLGIKLKQIATQSSLAVLSSDISIKKFTKGRKEAFDMVKYVTNYMTSSFNGENKKPALGKAWSHIPHLRVIVQRPLSGQGPKREAVLVKSSRQQTPKSVFFSLLKETLHESGS